MHNSILLLLFLALLQIPDKDPHNDLDNPILHLKKRNRADRSPEEGEEVLFEDVVVEVEG
jgi:hypothetical protein